MILSDNPMNQILEKRPIVRNFVKQEIVQYMEYFNNKNLRLHGEFLTLQCRISTKELCLSKKLPILILLIDLGIILFAYKPKLPKYPYIVIVMKQGHYNLI